MTAARLLDRGAERFPDALLFDDSALRMTYAEARALSTRLANALAAAGSVKGDHFLLLGANNPHIYIALMGCWRAGMISLGINAKDAIEDQISMTKSRGVAWIFYHSDFAENAARIREAMPGVKGVICVNGPCGDDPGMESFAEGHAEDKGGVLLEPDDIMALSNSGGTTGAPKSVSISVRAFRTMIASFMTEMTYTEKPVYLAAAPLTHAAGGLSYPMLPLGGRFVLMAKPEPELIMQTIEREKVTTLFLPPTLIYMMLAHPNVRDYDYSSLRYLVYAASPMTPEKIEEAMDVFGPVIAQTYGQAEAPMVCTYMDPKDYQTALETGDKKVFSSCGRATVYTDIAIMNEDGALLKDGEIGELVVRGDIVMTGYQNNHDATEDSQRFGWHHTGDVGYRDENGFFYLVDRARDMIISGGFNIYPSEIERVILTNPAVQDCAVIGVPDAKWGEAVKAVVELRQDASITEDEILNTCKTELGSMKTPKSVEFWPELPKSPVGKILKRKVREKFWAGKSRSIG
ncbi:MAG: AMP-binding protein [Pseudomonadota bacterium]